jgi:hypothetical protein
MSTELQNCEVQKDGKSHLYTRTWCNVSLTSGADSIEEMILMLMDGVETLQEMRRLGVWIDPDLEEGDGHTELYTTDPEVAEIYGFEPGDAEKA